MTAADATPGGNPSDASWSVPGYRAIRMLGFGAAGEVWEGVEESTGDRVALKRVRTDRPDGDRGQLRREAALLAAFRHPGVVRLRAVRALDADLVLVLDLAEGGSLAQVMSRVDRLRSAEVVGFVAPVAEALAAAHREGVLHGDVSPRNLLLTADGCPLLADLGTARLAGDERAPVRATSRYLDPAVRAGGPLTTASDVYALAAVAAHALTARPLSTSSGALQQWADQAYTLGVPAPLAAALCAGLATHPARRPDAQEFAASLRACCEPATLARLLPPMSDHGVSAEEVAGEHASGESEDGEVDPDSLTHLVTGAVRAPVPAAPRSRRWWRRRERQAVEPADDLTGWPAAVVRAASPPAPDRPERAPDRPERAPDRPERAPGRPELAVAGSAGRSPRPPRVRPVRELVVRVAAVVVLVAVAAAGGVWWAALDDAGRPAGGTVTAAELEPSSSLSSTPLTSASKRSDAPAGAERVSADRWRTTLDALDAARATAFARADPALLTRVYTPGSPALRADGAAVRALAAAGVTAVGVRHELRTVRVAGVDAGRVRLAVTDRMAGYRIVDGGGVVLRVVPPRAEAAFRVELHRTGAGWRIATVTR